MSVEAMTLVQHHSLAGDPEFRVLMAIANYHGSEEAGAWPSIATLAEDTHKSPRTVQRLIRNVVELGELAVTEKGGGTHKTRDDRRPNRYDLLVRCPEGCGGGLSHKMPKGAPRGVRVGTSSTSAGDVNLDTSPDESRGVNLRAETAPRGVNLGAHEVSTLTPETVSRTSQVEQPVSNPPTPLALEGVAASPAATGVSRQGQIDAVFQAWRTATGRTDATKLDGKRTALIARQLRLYPVEDLCDAVRGWRHFPHNRGETNGTRYDGLDLCLRDAEHIERFRDAERGTAATPELTGMARIRAMTNAPPAAPQRFGQIIDVAAS